LSSDPLIRMILQIFLLLIFHYVNGSLMSTECVEEMENFHLCMKKENAEYRQALKSFDGRRHFYERKTCNYFKASVNCSAVLTENCFSEQEKTFLLDNDASAYVDYNKILRHWDPQKCPPAKDYLDRLNSGLVDSSASEDCKQKIKEFRDCRISAMESLMGDLRSASDGKSYYKERKECNFLTLSLSTCPANLPPECVSEDLVQKMRFWWMINDEEILENFSFFKSDKCPAVSDVLTAWKEVKNPKLAAIEVYTTNEVVMGKAVEYKGLLVANMVNTIAKDNLTELSGMLKKTRKDLLEELTLKAAKVNADAITGLKMEIHSVFDGTFNVVLYGTAVSF